MLLLLISPKVQAGCLKKTCGGIMEGQTQSQQAETWCFLVGFVMLAVIEHQQPAKDQVAVGL
jgi:hypothetical protein